MTAEDMKSNRLIFSPAPHIHNGSSISGTMYTIIIALIPAAIFGIMTYKMDAVRVISLAIASAMLSEWLIQKVFGKPVSISDGSAMLTGLVLALILPASTPWWMIVIGCFISILIGKQIFGGNGGNPFNPVLIGWAALRLSWPAHMNLDIASATYKLQHATDYPLAVLKSAGASALFEFKPYDLLMGNQVGGIGSIAVLLLLIGGVFLIVRGVISWQIPTFFLLGIVLTGSIFWLADSSTYASPLFHILTGNAMIGAFFLSTEHSSSPVNGVAQAIYGLMGGMFVVLFRAWSIYPDAVIFAILLINILNPMLDKITPKVPGKELQKVSV